MPRISFKFIFIPGILILSVFSIIILKSCEKEKYQHPVVHTGEVTDITPEGAMFHGRITEMGSEDIVYHGFVWGMMREPNLKNSNSLKLGKLENETFSAIAKAGFIKGRRFHVRAFVSTPEITVYGGVISYISDGGKSHEVIDFYPKEGIWGDTITINGNYFNQDINNNIVRFDSYNAKIIKASNNELEVIVPGELDKIYSNISVEFHNHTVLHKDSFYILPPIIDSISPVSGNKNTFISIFSNGFHIADKNNRIFLDTIELEILESYGNRIVTKPSFFNPHGENNLQVKTLGQKSKNYKSFFKIEPWKRLPDTELNGSDELVSFSIGDRLFAGKTDESRGFYEYVPAANEWIKMADIPFTYPSIESFISISADSKGYLILIYPTVGVLYTYSSSEDKWTSSGILPFSPKNSSHRYSFSVANDLYIGTHDNLVWKYSSDSNTWTQLNNNLFQISACQGFAFGGFGYVMGFIGSEGAWGIVKYDQYSDSWTMVADFSDISIINPFLVIRNSIVWSMESSIIILIGISNRYILIEFLPKTNGLVFHGQVPIKRVISPFRFSSGNRGYLGSGRWVGGHNWPIINDFWEFDLDLLTF
ncbi:MAG: hypothetical protein EA393_12225 [Bacteroidetes bacterium]|nr:MAG: hypothetical protein EA393_12225 [Bacteroidota bacterium]